MVGLGTLRQRVVFYPISHPNTRAGLAMINWIAEVTMDNTEGCKQRGWFRQVSIDDYLHRFENWIWDWLDVRALIRQANTVFENPMVDRDPVPTWRDGPVPLLGDAAHVISPPERAEFMAGYKAAAGFAIEKLNTAPQTIPNDAHAQ